MFPRNFFYNSKITLNLFLCIFLVNSPNTKIECDKHLSQNVISSIQRTCTYLLDLKSYIYMRIQCN